MIHIFFVPGMFGSTIEYVLRDYTIEMEPTYAVIAADGSMHHTVGKMYHPTDASMLADGTKLSAINTPIYPFNDMHLQDIIKEYKGHKDDYYILVYADSIESAEQNMLFQYHKISQGKSAGIDMFYGSPTNAVQDVTKWNQNYKKYSDLSTWEFREWFSIFYPSWVEEWRSSCNQVPSTWFKISNSDILVSPLDSFNSIINFCNLTQRDGLDKFASRWKQAQQYILNEYKLINTIVDATINQEEYTWSPLHIIAEAIIQKKLRDAGFEIRCDGLNTLPVDSRTLYNLLYKV